MSTTGLLKIEKSKFNWAWGSRIITSFTDSEQVCTLRGYHGRIITYCRGLVHRDLLFQSLWHVQWYDWKCLSHNRIIFYLYQLKRLQKSKIQPWRLCKPMETVSYPGTIFFEGIYCRVSQQLTWHAGMGVTHMTCGDGCDSYDMRGWVSLIWDVGMGVTYMTSGDWWESALSILSLHSKRAAFSRSANAASV